MRVFLTGATGFVGSWIVPELIAGGHAVTGLARSNAGARRLEAAGAAVLRSDLEDLDSLARGAGQADAVIHTAFDHDFSRFAENCDKNRRVIKAMGAALAGSDRPLLVTSGTGLGSPGPGRPASEDVVDWDHPVPRVASEKAGAARAAAGVRVVVVRLPQVHDAVRQGLITFLVEIARTTRLSAYVGEGANRWPAAHVDDVARLYRLALEKGEAGARYHAVAEEGVALRGIAEVIGAGLEVPVAAIPAGEAPSHFGWLAAFAGLDLPASGALTRERLGWRPFGPGLLADLAGMAY